MGSCFCSTWIGNLFIDIIIALVCTPFPIILSTGFCIFLAKADILINPSLNDSIKKGERFISSSTISDNFFIVKFLTKVNYSATPPDKAGNPNQDAAVTNAEELKKQIEAQRKTFILEEAIAGYQVISQYKNSAGDIIYSTIIDGVSGTITTLYDKGPSGQAFEKLINDLADAEENVKINVQMAVENNLKKIDIVPNPYNASVNSDALQAGAGFTAFNNNFKIYCCDDTQLFDILKNNAFLAYPSDKTSPPLPIKYTFKILGKSGLRRGDIFNIAGIPRKYAEHGFFQIINIEQNIQGSLWTTSITGQYRQNIKNVKK